MKKWNAVLSYVLAVLEGGLAGVCFYRAGKEREPKRRTLFYIISAGWLILSALNSAEGVRRLKALREDACGEAEPER